MSGPVATTRETLDWVLGKSKREGRVPVHKDFLQIRHRRGVRPGPLAAFVAAGRGRALDLYLLALLLGTAKPYRVAQPAGVWARLLGVGSDASASSVISKQWRWLEDQKLIERVGRKGRWSEIQLLREDGSGGSFKPTLSGGLWFHVPFEYWTENWYGKLSLPGKAILLVGLSLLDDFLLPQEKGPAWYGISADTVGRGLKELEEHGLLKTRRLKKPSVSAPKGFTVERHYTLQPPFGPKGKRSKHLARARVVRGRA
jgi:DNA-binding transcriptional ArsR family regulator